MYFLQNSWDKKTLSKIEGTPANTAPYYIPNDESTLLFA